MKSNRTTIALLAVVVLTLSAGFAAGMLARRVSNPTDESAASSGEPSSTLVDDLQLKPQQRDRMRTIWENVKSDAQKSYQSALNLQKLRDQDLVAILNDEQKAQFEKISSNYAARFDQLSKNRDQRFQDAVQETRQLLDESQRKKYDEILKHGLGGNSAAAASGASSSIQSLLQ